MKFTATITRSCNLACPYCYIACDGRHMSEKLADQAVDLASNMTTPGEKLDFGFFGGEPLLQFDLIQHMVQRLKVNQLEHGFVPSLGMTTNGVLMTEPVLEFMAEEGIVPCVSIDGPRDVFDRLRVFKDGKSCFDTVVENLEAAADVLPAMKINAVFGPDSLIRLPEIVQFLCEFGVPVELNLDVTALWNEETLEKTDQIFSEIGEFYLKRFMAGEPAQIQPLADHLFTAVVGGVEPESRCTLGVGEIAIDVDGRIYPCERLIGQQDLVIGDLQQGIDREKQALVVAEHRSPNAACNDCPLANYCNHSCGCTNWFLTGNYGTASRAVCKIEKSWFKVSRNLLGPLLATKEFNFHFLETLQLRCQQCTKAGLP